MSSETAVATPADEIDVDALIKDGRPDSELTREEIIARNLKVVDAHFHSENPDAVDQAIALYADGISWEAPSRGIVYTDAAEVRKSYINIFKTFKYNRTISLRRFATEEFVFDDQIADVEVVDSLVPNLPYQPGTRMNVRLVHCFQLRDGKITHEIAYEIWRKFGSPVDNDSIPEGSVVDIYDASKF